MKCGSKEDQLARSKHYNTRLSSEAVDLLIKLLDPNPKTRITSKAALAHPWFRSVCDSNFFPLLPIEYTGIHEHQIFTKKGDEGDEIGEKNTEGFS